MNEPLTAEALKGWAYPKIVALDDLYGRKWKRLSLADQRLLRDVMAGLRFLADNAVALGLPQEDGNE